MTEPVTLCGVLTAEADSIDMSRADIARESGVGVASVHRIFQGEQQPSLVILLRILAALNRDLTWLHNVGIRPPE